MIPGSTCIHREFQARVDEAPERVALLVEWEALSYAALEARVNRLAHVLRELGVGPEVCVGVCLERGADLVVALMATLVAGGAYVPLDPDHPDARLAHIVGEARPAVILTHGQRRARFGDARVIALDGDEARAFAGTVAERADDRSRPSDLACVVYTSGSTGPPKGVMVEHRALAARFALSPYRALMAPGAVLAAVTAPAWAPSVYEVTFGLARGVTIALAGQDVVRDPARLGRFIAERGVTFMRAVPSLWQGLLDAGWQGKADLAIVTHGEASSPRLARRLATRGRCVWNTFGSTEATVFARVTHASAGAVVDIDDTGDLGMLTLLDAEGLPARDGEPAELHVGGAVIARGYLGDQALTARRFYDGPRGVRLHATGDLARRLADGRIELLGRADHQVKVRGQRVELGEVEAALARDPDVLEAVVVVREEHPGDVRLVAWVVTRSGEVPAGWRARLTEALPAFMVPTTCVALAALPRNARGKVDRSALPAPERSRTAAPAPFEGAVELAIGRAFADALDLPPDDVGAEDDFFASGGHSLAAARVMARLNREHGLDLSIAELFTAPTARALARTVTARLAAGGRTPRPALRRLDRRDHAALSFAQERLWFLSRLVPGDFAYNLPMADRLLGPLDVDAIHAALRLVVGRHEALRTRLAADAQGRATQSVLDLDALGGLPLPVHDLGHLPPEARVAAAGELIARASIVPFDLGRPPLVRAALYRLGPEDHVLAIDMHHVASDGWSKIVMRRELAQAYDALAEGRAPALPALPIQVLDHAAWQRASLGEVELRRQLAYWRERLAGLEPLTLPGDRPRPRVFTHRGARRARRLGPELTRAVRALARRAGASLFMTLAAAFHALIHRWTRRTDIAIGSPIAGRGAPEIEGLVGLFVNTLVLRLDVAGDLSFEDLLARSKQATLEAFAHQDVPFERLVGELNPERDMGRHPLVQVVFALQSTPLREPTLVGLTSEPFPFPHEMTRLDLELHVWEREGGLDCHVIYNVDLFDAWRMDRLLEHLEALLEGVTADPTRPIGDVPLLTAEERRALAAWNRTERAFPHARPVHELFAEQAARAPERLAIEAAGVRLTYGQLADRSRQLASHLRASGIGEGARIAVLLPRSAELLTIMLAAMQIGAAWVPLDPDHPPARLVAMLGDAGVALVVTVESLDDRLAGVALPVLRVDGAGASGATWRSVARQATTWPADVPADPDRVAYVVHTSGSTGRPNGVEVTHRGLTNVVLWHRERHAVTADDRAMLFSSPAFDASILETWPYLVTGASLHVVEPDARLVPARLGGWLRERAITIGFLPPAVLEPCLAAGVLEAPTLRAIVTGGEALRARPRAGARFVLHNHYGPTEISVCATAAVVSPWDADGPAEAGAPLAAPPIGGPIANIRAYVLDERGGLAPIGVPGELLLGGEGVARGYAGRPELTASRFLTRSDLDPGRLYRTGDLVRWRPDGELEFLGRVDDQVKIRGVRVEPGEVDATLTACPGVARALTLVREDAPGDRRLVSYVTLTEPTADDEVEHVERWRALYDRELPATIDEEFVGWNSSFTGRPIPADEMREWVGATLARVRAFRPERVLEIGCGRGLVLVPLAREVAAITGTDLSAQGLARIRRVVDAERPPAAVRLVHAPAHDLAWLDPEERFDTVLLSSVTQYLPSGRYLAEVIAGLAPHVAPGGRFVIADVRNLELAEVFRAALIAAAREDSRLAGSAARDEASVDDEELLLAPAFFEEVAERVTAATGRGTRVEVRPRGGRARNEMTAFRFDVTLHMDAAPRRERELAELRWGRDVTGLDALGAVIRASQRPLVVRGLVDARLAPHLTASDRALAVEPDDLAALATAAGARAELGLERGSMRLVAAFVASGAEPFVPAPERAPVPGAPLASDPLLGMRARRVVPALRERAAASLPEVMLPSAFVVLPGWPLNASGKVERGRLPAPRADRAGRDRAESPPRSTLERALAGIFEAVLGVPGIGRDDGFFELGGHSLLAVQLVTRIHDLLGVDLPLSAIFEAPTVAALAGRVAVNYLAPEGSPVKATAAGGESHVTKLPLSPMDVNFHYGRIHFGADPHAWYQVLELDIEPVEPERLGRAILAAVNRHPVARGRVSARDGFGGRVWWDVSPRHRRAPLETRHARDEAELVALRDRVLASPFSLDEAPSCRFTLLRRADRDTLMVQYSHGAIDGSGLRCLLRSVMAEYLGRPDPALRIVPWTTEELLALYAHDGAFVDNVELAHLTRLLPASLRPARLARVHTRMSASLARPDRWMPARVRGEGGNPQARGARRVDLALSTADTARLSAGARRAGTTLDRLFVAACLDGTAAWNRARAPDGDPGRVECYWAVNLRPPRYFDSVVANLFSWSRVRAPERDREGWLAEVLDPASDFLLRGALDWIRFVEWFHRLPLPDVARRLAMRMIERTAPSIVVSNTLPFGELADDPLARDFGVRSYEHHSRHAFTDRPVIVIGQHQGRLRLRMIYPLRLFSESGAAGFLEAVRDAALALADRLTSAPAPGRPPR